MPSQNTHERFHEAMRPTRLQHLTYQSAWRYMNFFSLLEILQTNKLFFPRIERLGDPYEGALHPGTRALFLKYGGQAVVDKFDPQNAMGAATRSEAIQYAGEQLFDLFDQRNRDLEASCVSCWHLNDIESAAMWKLYAFESGVAIKSSVGRLIEAFTGTNTLAMAVVEYAEFDQVESPPFVPYPMFLKRRSFSHEHELRLVTIEDNRSTCPDGVHVKAELPILIDRIYITPTAPSWVADVVRREVDRFPLKLAIIHSSLYSNNLK